MNDRVRALYKEAHEFLLKAKELLESKDALTDAQRDQIDRWRSQAAEIETRAGDLQKVLERDAELLALENEESAKESKAVAARTDNAGFKSPSDYMVALYNFRTRGKYDSRFEQLEVKALSGETGVSGGFLLPTEMQRDILLARGELSFLRSRAKIVQMGSRVVPYPALDYSQGASGVSAFFGGVKVYYIEEGEEITESEFKLKNVELHARYLAGLTLIPNTLISDSPISLISFLQGNNSFGGALAFKEDYDALNGDGAGKPLGILNSPAKLTVTRNTSNDFKFVDAVTMKSKMLMSGAPVWIMNQSVMPKLYTFVDAGNNNLFLPAVRGLDGKPMDMLLGNPIIWTEKLPALGTAGDVMFVDLGFYLLGDRNTVSMDIDTSVKFTSNKTAFRVLEGIDGQPWLANKIKLADGTTEVSPYVVLN
jgi:HK97 family phage major capsid protein